MVIEGKYEHDCVWSESMNRYQVTTWFNGTGGRRRLVEVRWRDAVWMGWLLSKCVKGTLETKTADSI